MSGYDGSSITHHGNDKPLPESKGFHSLCIEGVPKHPLVVPLLHQCLVSPCFYWRWARSIPVISTSCIYKNNYLQRTLLICAGTPISQSIDFIR